ncbi:MAG: hypothetical protein HMLIMOIP_000929 [Candidatus Nitrosomirales archaeon]
MEPIRTKLVHAIIRDLLGPRNGSEEEITDPNFEYVTGVLEPRDYEWDPIFDYDYRYHEVMPPSDYKERSTNDLDDIDGDAWNELTFSTETNLDPRARPKSLGISFLVKGDDHPKLDLCFTWARYKKISKNKWKRIPQGFFQRDINASDKWDHTMCDSKIPKGTGTYLLPTKVGANVWRVSIYFVNETPLANKKMMSPDNLIFQPQIRVRCGKGTQLVHMREIERIEEDERNMSLLFSNRPMLGRGHFCSAVWKDVDPARSFENQADSHSPFNWVDQNLFPAEVADYFKIADIRSEYLPCYSMQQPRLEPFLDVGVLAETWEPKELLAKLQPLATDYEKWINVQEKEIDNVDKELQKYATKNLDNCRRALSRIKAGISLLITDENARLAFCFMNKVMSMQFWWTERLRGVDPPRPLKWYRFQIAFILQCLQGIVDPAHPDRALCDLLWFPTGGGKTEAYLGLAVFALAHRRRVNSDIFTCDGGVAVISRYTLRLLTIQQFRRTLKSILACDILRVTNWKPEGCSTVGENLWGKARFSIGLWVGAGITPNNLEEHYTQHEVYLGALGLLAGRDSFRAEGRRVVDSGQGEPTQILNCPCCDTILAVPSDPQSTGLEGAVHTMNWIFRSSNPRPDIQSMNAQGFTVQEINIRQLPSNGYYAASVKFSSQFSNISAERIDSWWNCFVSKGLGNAEICSARASRPGYFIRYAPGGIPFDFEIRCPNLDCPLNNVEWFEQIPSPDTERKYDYVLEPFRTSTARHYSFGVPISAFMVDSQIYRHCPSFIISTVDKFARLSFEPYTSSLIGNVNRYDSMLGYFREELGPEGTRDRLGYQLAVKPFARPTLIIQDELHLIEGPLGSLVGLYETGIDILTTSTHEGTKIVSKYIASTATIKEATSQIRCLYNRDVAQFPPAGMNAEDNHFAVVYESHALDAYPPGRLYLGVCTPGKALLTQVRIWSALMAEMERIRDNSHDGIEDEIDYFWTVVGYFNAVRELAIGLGLYGQDIEGRLRDTRELNDDNRLELSSQSSSHNLPSILKRLESGTTKVDALFTTAMFGTGVDINRLGLMIVHGQPKNTSSYIQATGRVGRRIGGLVVTFLRSTRPRDLNHYEFFMGYHRALHRFVEPVTVSPFSPGALDRGLGPIVVALLRNALEIDGVKISSIWCQESRTGKKGSGPLRSGSRAMKNMRGSVEVRKILEILEGRSQRQPVERKPAPYSVSKLAGDLLDRWERFAKVEDDLIYWEQTMTGLPQHPSVLGSPQYEDEEVVFRNAPQSLREVEPAAQFGDGE